MKILSVQIENWRSIRALEMQFQDLLILIGQNNHGKSNILSALLFFFGEIKAQDLDFNTGAQELYVDVTFVDLDDTDRMTFKKYLSSAGTIRVRKTAYFGGAFEYKGFIQNPNEAWLKEANAGEYASRDTISATPLSGLVPTTGRITKQHVLDAQRQYIEAHRDTIGFNFELEETNFLGLKSVAKGIFGDFYFIPAVKDATDDFATKEASAFGRIYSAVIESMSASNPDWKETKDKLTSLFGTLNRHDHDGTENATRPAELVAFEESLCLELVSWGAKIDVKVAPPDIDDVFRANTQVWVDDGVRTDIRRKGHGLQRALTLALIKVIASTVQKERQVAADDGVSARAVSASTYFVLEEPELYLHPQAQRALFDSLVSLSEAKNQVIICTHSSALIDVERYKSICIVRKDSDVVGTDVCQCVADIFTGDAKKDFNLSYWINPDRSEMFFAKKVVLVEGPTDKTCIPLLAKRLGVFRYDYTLVDCGSKDNLPLYMQLLSKFRIPYIAIYDVDHQAHKDVNAIVSADVSTARVLAAIDPVIGSAVPLVNDIEEELGMVAGSKNKPYLALLHISQDTFVMPPVLESKVRHIFA